ncbi:MAG TPA: glycosyltransferase family 4 protein [Coleofasciculaceae cyanobacterium]|jgi:glycosyltransferase involved in cell wall biosynthesis
MASILYIAQFFSTESEPGGQGQRHFKHASALAEDGHAVTVITSGCTTMQLSMHEGEAGEHPANIWLHPNLSIIKLPVAPLDKRSVISRAQRYLAFSTKALFMGLKLLFIDRRKFHFVLGSSPPLLIALVAWMISVLARADFYLEVRDLWSQTMAANGFINNPLAIRANRWLESFLYKVSKKIIVVSPSFEGEIEAQVPGSQAKTEYIPNGADMEFYQYPRLWRGSFLRNTEEERQLFQVNYAGVFSDYTKLETLLKAAAMLQEQTPEIRFNLVGGGYQFEKLRGLAEELKLRNVRFWGALPKNRVSKFIMEGDLSIINYRKLGIFGQVLPNKLFDYLAAGRPILAGVPEGEVSRVLEESGAGLCVEPENVQAMAEKILWFYHNQSEGQKMGVRGQHYVSRKFHRNQLVENFLELFPRVIQLNPNRHRELACPVDNIVPFPATAQNR